jgi:hypothetical protein
VGPFALLDIQSPELDMLSHSAQFLSAIAHDFQGNAYRGIHKVIPALLPRPCEAVDVADRPLKLANNHEETFKVGFQQPMFDKSLLAPLIILQPLHFRPPGNRRSNIQQPCDRICHKIDPIYPKKQKPLMPHRHQAVLSVLPKFPHPTPPKKNFIKKKFNLD